MMDSASDRPLTKIDQILEGAMQEFLIHGFAGTSMDRVASAAGVSKATVYSHFQDKEGLFKALIEHISQDKLLIVMKATDQADDDPRLVLYQLAMAIVTKVRSDPQIVPFMRLLLAESGRFPESAQLSIRSLDQPGIAKISQYLASRPELKISDPEATARIFIGSIVHFLINQEMLQGKDLMPMDPERLITSLIDLIAGKSSS